MPPLQHHPASGAAARTHHSQPTLNACADRKQAEIIFISLLTTDEHRLRALCILILIMWYKLEYNLI